MQTLDSVSGSVKVVRVERLKVVGTDTTPKVKKSASVVMLMRVMHTQPVYQQRKQTNSVRMELLVS